MSTLEECKSSSNENERINGRMDVIYEPTVTRKRKISDIDCTFNRNINEQNNISIKKRKLNNRSSLQLKNETRSNYLDHIQKWRLLNPKNRKIRPEIIIKPELIGNISYESIIERNKLNQYFNTIKSEIKHENTMPIIIQREKYKKLRAKRKNSDVSIKSNPDTNNQKDDILQKLYERKMTKIDHAQSKITDYFQFVI